MKPQFLSVLVAVSLVFLFAQAAWPSPVVSERDPLEPFRRDQDARDVVTEYFTASKNGDAKRAASLIDYEEWAKELGYGEKEGRLRAKEHREDLVVEYRQEKAAGSTKVFKVLKETVQDDRAVFEVTQDRADGVYTWEIRLLYKTGRWAIVRFRLLSIER